MKGDTKGHPEFHLQPVYLTLFISHLTDLTHLRMMIDGYIKKPRGDKNGGGESEVTETSTPLGSDHSHAPAVGREPSCYKAAAEQINN